MNYDHDTSCYSIASWFSGIVPCFHMQRFLICTLISRGLNLLFQNDDEPGVLNNIKSEICDVLTLFASKYDDDFDPFVAGFVKAVIELLMKITQLMQDDSVGSC